MRHRIRGVEKEAALVYPRHDPKAATFFRGIHLQAIFSSLSPRQWALAEYVLMNHENVIHLSIADMRTNSGAGPSTIMGLCRQLGVKDIGISRPNLRANWASFESTQQKVKNPFLGQFLIFMRKGP